MSLLPSNSTSMRHLDSVGDKLEERCIWIVLWLEIGDVFVEGDAGVE